MIVYYTVVADYFASRQKFRGPATKRDTQIFRGGKFMLITSAKKNSARNNLLLTRAIVLMELCMRGYHVYSEATAGEELLCRAGAAGTAGTVLAVPLFSRLGTALVDCS